MGETNETVTIKRGSLVMIIICFVCCALVFGVMFGVAWEASESAKRTILAEGELVNDSVDLDLIGIIIDVREDSSIVEVLPSEDTEHFISVMDELNVTFALAITHAFDRKFEIGDVVLITVSDELIVTSARLLGIRDAHMDVRWSED